MSAYITLADIRKRISESKLVQLTDFDNEGIANETKVDECIGAASSTIDSYCGTRYALPLTASDQVKDHTMTICLYKLYNLRGKVPDHLRQDYDDTLLFLKDVAMGKATMDQSAAIQSATGSEVITRDHDNDPEIFDDTRIEEW